MNPLKNTASRLLLALLITGLTAGLISWGDHPADTSRFTRDIADTTPKPKSAREKSIRDLDDVLAELESGDVQKELERAQKELQEALKKIDPEKIRLEVENALKEVDMAKIQKEVQESLAKLDMAKLQKEIQESVAKIDLEKIQKEVQESLAKADAGKIQEELAVEMKKMQEELKGIQPRLEKELAKAREEIEKARAEIKEYKEFVDALDKDGLINKKEGYKLKHKDGDLFINGKKADAATYSKYRSFLEKHKKFSIDKDLDDFDIDMD